MVTRSVRLEERLLLPHFSPPATGRFGKVRKRMPQEVRFAGWGFVRNVPWLLMGCVNPHAARNAGMVWSSSEARFDD